MLIDMGYIIRKEPLIMGSNGYAPEELAEALELMQARRIDRAGLISHRFADDRIMRQDEPCRSASAV